jgi:hypothetical protein
LTWTTRNHEWKREIDSVQTALYRYVLLDETKKNEQKGMFGIEGRRVADGLEMLGTCIVFDLFNRNATGSMHITSIWHKTPSSPASHNFRIQSCDSTARTEKENTASKPKTHLEL